MARPQQLFALGLLGLAVALTAGCGTVRTETGPEAERQPGSDGPGVLPNQNKTGGSFLGGLFDGDEDETAEASATAGDLHGRIARLEETLRAGSDGPDRLTAAAAASARPGPAVGLLFGEAVLTPAKEAAYRVMERLSGPYPLTVVGPARIRQVLERYGCPAAAALDCAAALAVTPGIRLLARIDGLSNIEGNSVTAEITLLDTDLELRHPPFRLRLPVTAAGIPEDALAALADAVFLNALERLRLTPPIYHVVASQGDRWLLNRGRDSGLAVGDVLSVHDGGILVRGPGGAPAAWMPGPVTGRLRVEGFAGEAAAVARLLEGAPPRPADPLTPAH